MDLSTLHKLVLERCSGDHQRAGVKLDADPVSFEAAAKQRRSLGRYTLEEAALFIEIEGLAEYQTILNEIEVAIVRGELYSYMPGRNGIYRHTFITYAPTLEVYGSEMNAWLEKNQPRIGKVFPLVSDSNGPSKPDTASCKPKPIKERTGLLDHLIQIAIAKAGSQNANEVFYKLTEMILEGAGNVLPFTGLTEGGLLYVDHDEKKKVLTLSMLRQRLRRRRNKLSP